MAKSSYLSLLTTSFALAAFILMWVGSVRCNFLKFTDISGTSEPISFEFGIWAYQYWTAVFSTEGTYMFKTCYRYPDSLVLDAPWKATRAFGVLAFVSAIIVMVVKCTYACSSDPEKVYSGGRGVAPLYLLTGIFQGLTLLFLHSKACTNNALVGLADNDAVVFPDTCSISTGAKCIISATVFWLCAALSSFQEQKALEEERSFVEPESFTEPLTGA